LTKLKNGTNREGTKWE